MALNGQTGKSLFLPNFLFRPCGPPPPSFKPCALNYSVHINSGAQEKKGKEKEKGNDDAADLLRADLGVVI